MPPEEGHEHPSSGSDQELVRAFARGDASAFVRLYERHRDFVARVARRYCRSDDEAADITQEVFTDLLARFPGFRLHDGVRLSTYLFPVARHAALARRRKLAPDLAEDELLEAALSDGVGAAPPPPTTEDERARLSERVWNALGRLPAPARECVILRFVDGLPLAQIARAQGVPVGTVKSRLHNALAALRAQPELRAAWE
jgi:RNA polymerase sigma-70 factor (ECF subfamily)